MNLFNGVSTLGTMMSYEETEAFIARWIDYVHTSHKESTLQYCHVINAFRHDHYNDMPQLLQGLQFDQPYWKIDSQLLLIIAHYKLGNEELTYTLIQNFKNQFKRNKAIIPPQVYEKQENLLEIIDLLIKSKYDRTIKIDLDKYDSIFYRTWVEKQLVKTQKESSSLKR